MSYVIGPHCMCCHECALICPQHAIDYVGTTYKIDPQKCVSCGACAKVCNISNIFDPDAAEAPQQNHPLRTLDADIVVLGGGASGLVAAVRAQELTGKKVLVLEKAKKCGGNGWYAHEFQVHGSKWQLDAGDDDRDETILSLQRQFKSHFSLDLIKKIIHSTGSFFDWLVDLDPEEAKACFELVESTDFWFQGDKTRQTVKFPKRMFYNLNCNDDAIGPGWGGSYVIRKMLQECEKRGIEVLTEHRAVKLLDDDTGAFRGVIARDPGGLTQVNAKACILATGNCAHNEELIRKCWPIYFGDQGDEKAHIFAVPTGEGDIVRLAESIGTSVDYSSFVANVFGPVHHPFSYILFCFMTNPEIMSVNLDGKRFYNESDFSVGSHFIHAQPKRIAYSIIDSDTMTLLGERLLHDRKSRLLYSDERSDWKFAHYREEIEHECELDTPCKRADTLEELADLCGIDKKNFLETVARYNMFCEKGHDDDFLKPVGLKPILKPPFYAIYGKTATDQVSIGVPINDNFQVLNPYKEPIPGLFAVGDNAAGWRLGMSIPGEQRDHIVPDFTWACNSGFMSGAEAAEYVNSL